MKRAAITCLLAVATVVSAATPAGAGGWAVTTLDPLPAIAPGQPAVVGLTIRQHGVTPVELDGVEIVVMPESGPSRHFAARAEGPRGHYIAELVVPAGSHRWQVVQGGFGPQDLGTLTVGDGGGAVAPATPGPPERGWSAEVRYGLLALTGLSAVVLAGSLIGGGRRRRRAGVASA